MITSFLNKLFSSPTTEGPPADKKILSGGDTKTADIVPDIIGSSFTLPLKNNQSRETVYRNEDRNWTMWNDEDPIRETQEEVGTLENVSFRSNSSSAENEKNWNEAIITRYPTKESPSQKSLVDKIGDFISSLLIFLDL